MSRVIALERYVGKPVRDADGEHLGHLHEVRVTPQGRDLVVREYLVGGAGLVERFSLAGLARQIALVLGVRRHRGYVVPWDAMEFPEGEAARCTRRAAELERL
jgi:hypothetical protein